MGTDIAWNFIIRYASSYKMTKSVDIATLCTYRHIYSRDVIIESEILPSIMFMVHGYIYFVRGKESYHVL